MRRIVLVADRTAEQGVVANERALRACTGEILLIVDQDDVCYPDKAERLLDLPKLTRASTWSGLTPTSSTPTVDLSAPASPHISK